MPKVGKDINYVDWAEWIDSIREKSQSRLVAIFDSGKWKWRTLSRETRLKESNRVQESKEPTH